MKIAVLGTGSVGKMIGNKLISLGHEVKISTSRLPGKVNLMQSTVFSLRVLF